MVRDQQIEMLMRNRNTRNDDDDRSNPDDAARSAQNMSLEKSVLFLSLNDFPLFPSSLLA